MTEEFLLFDMDGVLLMPGGYQQALKASIKRIGKALGAPKTEITSEQIHHFEALSVTNEWDSLAICTALVLLQVWRIDSNMRLTDENAPKPENYLNEKPDFQSFLESFNHVGPLPGESAFQKIMTENTWLDPDQKVHLEEILFNCRDIYRSITLPTHQETVLGSQAFQENYQLEPKLNIQSYLLKYDQPVLSPEQVNQLRAWLEHQGHHIGILTNRPNGTPPDFISAPEAELGAKLVGLAGVPLLGSGSLNWYAESKCALPQHTFLKPNPVHTLGLMQICLGKDIEEALSKSIALWEGQGKKADWESFEGAKVFIFEDSIKGLQSGLSAKSLLGELGIEINLQLIGVSENPIKKQALLEIAEQIIPTINLFNWSF